jgi:signal transduction histidine kinase
VPFVERIVENLLANAVRHTSLPSSHSPGTGVGFSLVERFTALHRGRVWVDDRPGGGASFHVFLPDVIS